MSKKLIVGLDIGVNSVGFAVVSEAESNEILQTGVRIVNEDPDFHGKFYQGNKASKNDSRTLNRGIRRGTDRYQARREQLTQILESVGMMPDEDLLERITSIELYGLRDKAIKEKISLQELGRILFHLNQKRGFQSSRKSQSEEENNSDYLAKIQALHELVTDKTIGSYMYEQLTVNPFFRIKDNIFPRSDYQREFDLIWNTQKQYYPEVLTGGPNEEDNRGTLYRAIRNETIYYQRRLKSAKHLVSKCTFEPQKRVIPKSHPVFQQFKLWQSINNVQAKALDGEVVVLTNEQRFQLFQKLHEQRKISSATILKILKLSKSEYTLNYDELDGNTTFLAFRKIFEEANIFNIIEDWMHPNTELFENKNDIHPFIKLWQITYSLESEKEVISALVKQLQLPENVANTIAKKIGYTPDYGSLSSKAIKKLLPYLKEGKTYDSAVLAAGYMHHSDLYKSDVLDEKLSPVYPNTLRNPVVEQVLNQVVNVVNQIIETYGKPTEFRIELARELKNNARKRKSIQSENKKRNTEASQITNRLMHENNFKRVTMRDIQRYRLFEETQHICLYCSKNITLTEVYDASTEIEHIIPRSRIFSNAHSNYILAHTACNKVKAQQTAYDFMKGKTASEFENYLSLVDKLFKSKQISKQKYDFLLMPGDKIPNDFLDRQIKDTQYIARETVFLLKTICPNVYSTSGSVTDLLKEKWNLRYLLEEINLPVYRAHGLTEIKEDGTGKRIEKIINWDKRKDHRHHALDALIIALTKQAYIQKLNNLSQQYQHYSDLKQSAYEFPEPFPNFRQLAKHHLESILVSFKKPNSKVLTKKVNRIKTNDKKMLQETWVPRGRLHEETVLGRIKRYKKGEWKELLENPDLAVDNSLKLALKEFVALAGDNKTALKKLKSEGLTLGEITIQQPLIWDYYFTKRVKLNEQLTQAQITKIADSHVRKLVEARIAVYGNIKTAFKDYANNPIFLNADKKIPIKTATVLEKGNFVKVRDGYVTLGNNHHAIIYRSETGVFGEKVVSFWEAVQTGMQNLIEKGSIYPVINYNPDPEMGAVYMTLQINDLFLINAPDELIDKRDAKLLAPYCYRLQTISNGDYRFRHQYQTNLDLDLPFAFLRIRSLNKFEGIKKVRLNNLGQIISITP